MKSLSTLLSVFLAFLLATTSSVGALPALYIPIQNLNPPRFFSMQNNDEESLKYTEYDSLLELSERIGTRGSYSLDDLFAINPTGTVSAGHYTVRDLEVYLSSVRFITNRAADNEGADKLKLYGSLSTELFPNLVISTDLVGAYGQRLPGTLNGLIEAGKNLQLLNRKITEFYSSSRRRIAEAQGTFYNTYGVTAVVAGNLMIISGFFGGGIPALLLILGGVALEGSALISANLADDASRVERYFEDREIDSSIEIEDISAEKRDRLVTSSLDLVEFSFDPILRIYTTLAKLAQLAQVEASVEQSQIDLDRASAQSLIRSSAAALERNLAQSFSSFLTEVSALENSSSKEALNVLLTFATHTFSSDHLRSFVERESLRFASVYEGKLLWALNELYSMLDVLNGSQELKASVNRARDSVDTKASTKKDAQLIAAESEITREALRLAWVERFGGLSLTEYSNELGSTNSDWALRVLPKVEQIGSLSTYDSLRTEMTSLFSESAVGVKDSVSSRVKEGLEKCSSWLTKKSE